MIKHFLPFFMVVAFIATATLADRFDNTASRFDNTASISSTSSTTSSTPSDAGADANADTNALITTLEGELEVLTSDIGDFFVLHTSRDKVVELKLRGVDTTAQSTLLQKSINGQRIRVRGINNSASASASGKDVTGESNIEDDTFDVIDVVNDDFDAVDDGYTTG